MRTVGSVWEDRARKALERAGLRHFISNWHCRYGEIDLVMFDADTLVFVEVRYRNATAHTDALASIGHTKRTKLVRAAHLFLAAHPALATKSCRFDVVAFNGTHCNWQRSAFEAF